MKKFEIFSHTADIGVYAYGKDLKEMFANCALAMFSIMTDITSIRHPRLKIPHLHVNARDSEDLLISWLNELLYNSSVKNTLYSKFDILEIDSTHIIADVYGEKIDARKHTIEKEIKAATYHQAKIEKTNNRYRATIIFDV